NHVLRTHHLHGNRRTALRSALSVLNLQCRDRSPDCDRYRERSGSDAGQSRLSRDPWQQAQQTHSKVRLVNLNRHAEKLSEAEDQMDLHCSHHASPVPVFCYEASAASSASAAEPRLLSLDRCQSCPASHTTTSRSPIATWLRVPT